MCTSINQLDSHIHSSRFMYNQNQQINSIGFTIKYQSPYNQCDWRTQSFTTREEAERMIQFYRSCGSPAEMVWQSERWHKIPSPLPLFTLILIPVHTTPPCASKPPINSTTCSTWVWILKQGRAMSCSLQGLVDFTLESILSVAVMIWALVFVTLTVVSVSNT